MSLLIGADLGGTKLSAVVCDRDGQVVHRSWQAHAAGDYASVLGAIKAAVDGCLEFAKSTDRSVDGLGLAIAGWMSRDRTQLLWGANIASRGVDLKSDLESMLTLPVAIENDGNATALAEQRHGAGRTSRSLALLTMGTGMGGGVVIDGQVLVGGTGLAGELGHIPVMDSPVVCICGGIGCAELFTSGRGLVEQYKLAVAVGTTADAPRTRSAEVVAAAIAGDTAALSVVHRAAIAVARTIQILIPTVDPDLVLLGGTVGHATGPLMLPIITAELERQRPLRAFAPAVRVALADLGPEAGAWGAAEIIRDHLASPEHRTPFDAFNCRENHR